MTNSNPFINQIEELELDLQLQTINQSKDSFSTITAKQMQNADMLLDFVESTLSLV